MYSQPFLLIPAMSPTVMPAFHPAYLLRQYTPDNRRKVRDDLQKVMARLGLEGASAK